MGPSVYCLTTLSVFSSSLCGQIKNLLKHLHLSNSAISFALTSTHSSYLLLKAVPEKIPDLNFESTVI